jgi:hypothetical protein
VARVEEGFWTEETEKEKDWAVVLEGKVRGAVRPKGP